MRAKRAIYIAAFVVFGLLAQFLIRAGLEMAMIELLLKDYRRYGLGLSWEYWMFIRHVLSVLLFALGAVGGYRMGVKWWQILYVEKRYGTPRF